MAYLLQTNEHREMRHLSGYAQPGDVVVSDDFRAVYTIAKDGSRRRVKDKRDAQFHVDTCHRLLAEKARAEEAAATKRAEEEQDIVIHPDRRTNSAQLSAMLAILAGGLAMSPPADVRRA